MNTSRFSSSQSSRYQGAIARAMKIATNNPSKAAG